MSDLSNIETNDLIKELKSRGFKTDLLYNRHDVELQVSRMNCERDEDEQQISFDDLDADSILDEVFDSEAEYICQSLNFKIQEVIEQTI